LPRRSAIVGALLCGTWARLHPSYHLFLFLLWACTYWFTCSALWNVGSPPPFLPSFFYFYFEPVLIDLLVLFQFARSTLQNRLNFPTSNSTFSFHIMGIVPRKIWKCLEEKRTNSLICVFVTLRFSNDLNGDSCDHPTALVNLTWRIGVVHILSYYLFLLLIRGPNGALIPRTRKKDKC
jgi:hypothetical protein